MTNQATVKNMTVEEWLAIHREAALQIDPETAEVMWKHANLAVPYGIYATVTSALAGYFLPVLREATCGSNLVICRRCRKSSEGKAGI